MLWVGFLPVLLAGSLLSAAKMPTPQSFRLPLAFEQNRGQAPAQVTWMGQGSSYRVLLGSDGATFLLPDKNDERAMAGRRPVPMDRSLRMKYSVMRMKLAGGRLPDGWERILARITSQYGDVYFVAVHSSLARSSLERLTSNGLFFSLAPRVAASRCPAYQNTSPNQVLQYVTVFTKERTSAFTAIRAGRDSISDSPVRARLTTRLWTTSRISTCQQCNTAEIRRCRWCVRLLAPTCRDQRAGAS